MDTQAPPDLPSQVTVIEPPAGRTAFDLAEVWKYRELLFFLAWRDVKVRYKQTLLGIAWAVLQPFMTMVAFSLFFGRLARIPSDGVPYPLFAFAALVPWTYFAQSLAQATNSIVDSQNLITKVYFSRLTIPMAAVLSGVVDFAIAFAILVAMMMWYGIDPTWRVLWIVPLLLLAMVSAMGMGVWLSAVNVKYRDVRYAVPFLIQFWLFVTPVAYPSSLLSAKWQAAYAVNPMVGVIEGFRWALLDTATAPGPLLAVSAGAALVILIAGIRYFQQTERSFADIV
jgi:lipopolysaccharide transport system permease protein